jgi:hypothetical protein
MHAKDQEGLAARKFHYLASRASGFGARGSSGLSCQTERVICRVQVLRSGSFE